MSTSTYVVNATVFGNLKNRGLVEKAAMEGRVIPPLVEYVPKGEKVELDPDNTATQRALTSGAIEKPGESQARRQSELQAEMDRLAAEQKALEAQMPAGDAGGSGDDGPSLEELRDEATGLGLAKSGNKAELADRIAVHKAGALTPAS